MSRGTDLRTRIRQEYDVIGVAAEALVDEICRTADELEILEDVVADRGPLIDGARGQPIRNPAFDAIARHRQLLARLIAQAFPAESESISERARRAARTRWTK